MATRLEVYRCVTCGNIVEVMHAGAGTLTCCNAPMTLLKENVTDASKEKHVPVIEKGKDSVTVKVGSVAHPMEEKHFIEWIEIIADGTIYRKYLKPGDKPEATFAIKADKIVAREYCNLHGFWKKE